MSIPMGVLVKTILWAVSVVVIAVPDARAGVTFAGLRRDSSVNPDEDLTTLMERTDVRPADIEIKEMDPYFLAIVGQILSEVGLLGGGNPGGLAAEVQAISGITLDEPERVEHDGVGPA